MQPNPKKKIVVKKKKQDDAILFTPKEQTERRNNLGLPTSKAEEKAYYDKMRKSEETVIPPKTKTKKAKAGTSLGMKSVKAGFDKNPGVTRADIITAAKGKAKSGASVKKAKSGTKMKKAMMGAMAKPMMKAGGKMTKCKYGCK